EIVSINGLSIAEIVFMINGKHCKCQLLFFVLGRVFIKNLVQVSSYILIVFYTWNSTQGAYPMGIQFINDGINPISPPKPVIELQFAIGILFIRQSFGEFKFFGK